MNKPIKIILLAVAILLAIGGVMVYYKTLVSPPCELKFRNQYVCSAKKDIADIKSANSDTALDSVFVTITHELDFQYSNSCLSADEKNDLLNDFADQYTWVYVHFCNSKFSRSIWNEKELQHIYSQVSKLLALKDTYDKSVIQGNNKSSLNEVSAIVGNYFAAKRVAMVNGYYGWPSAKQKIAEARKFANMYPLNNCTKLVSSLNSVPSRLDQTHYEYLESQVEQLQYYDSYSGDDYRRLVYNVSDKLEDYKKNAKEVYGSCYDIGDLERRASHYYSNSPLY